MRPGSLAAGPGAQPLTSGGVFVLLIYPMVGVWIYIWDVPIFHIVELHTELTVSLEET